MNIVAKKSVLFHTTYQMQVIFIATNIQCKKKTRIRDLNNTKLSKNYLDTLGRKSDPIKINNYFRF